MEKNRFLQDFLNVAAILSEGRKWSIYENHTLVFNF